MNKQGRVWDRDDLAVEVEGFVLDATQLIEGAEYAGHITGSGFHIRQEIAALAKKRALERWREKSSK